MINYLLHVRITNAKHVVEIELLALAALSLRRFFEITFSANVADYTFAIEALFEAAQSAFHGLSFTDFNIE